MTRTGEGRERKHSVVCKHRRKRTSRVRNRGKTRSQVNMPQRTRVRVLVKNPLLASLLWFLEMLDHTHTHTYPTLITE